MMSIRTGLLAPLAIAFALPSSALAANEFCASDAQKQRIDEFYQERPGTMPVIAASRLGLPAALVTSGLAAGQSVSAPGSAFAEVWAELSRWEQANFLIMKGNNVFEILSGVSSGAPSKTSSYFNIKYDNPLRGHLRPDEYAAIYAVTIPGKDESVLRGVMFFDADGDMVFGVFLSGESLHPPPGDLVKFDELVALVSSHSAVCP